MQDVLERLADAYCKLKAEKDELETRLTDAEAQVTALQVEVVGLQQYLDEQTNPRAADKGSMSMATGTPPGDLELYRSVDGPARARALDILQKSKLKSPVGEQLKDLLRFVGEIPDRHMRGRALVTCAELFYIQRYDERLKYADQAGACFSQRCGSYRILFDLQDGFPILRAIGRHEDNIYGRGKTGRKEH